VKKAAYVLIAMLATVLLSFGLTWFLHLASRPRDLYVAAGIIGAAVLFSLYWEVLKLCLKHLRREIRIANGSPDSAPPSKELHS
jgi:4-amino-4-deoxy-L-arabinose transferase-like glycosyltransferase